MVKSPLINVPPVPIEAKLLILENRLPDISTWFVKSKLKSLLLPSIWSRKLKIVPFKITSLAIVIWLL